MNKTIELEYSIGARLRNLAEFELGKGPHEPSLNKASKVDSSSIRVQTHI